MRRRFLFSLLVLLSASASSVAQVASRPVPPCPRPCDPGAVCAVAFNCDDRPAARIERISSSVHAVLDGRVVRYEVTETFVNRGSRVGEVDYLLPLPKGAAFEDLALSINGEMVTGETMSATGARAIYEEIVRRMRDPALVEWMGYGLLRTRIFPIQPGEEKRVVVRFRAVAEREGDALRLDWIGAGRNGDMGGIRKFSLAYPDDGVFGQAYSPTHALRTTRGHERWSVDANGASGPLTILVPVRNRAGAAIALLAHAPAHDDGYALITFSPPVRAARETPRDVVFVLDVSGSMSGRKMEQARAAGRQLLQSLTPQDRFRLIDFSSDVREFNDGWTGATGGNIRAALEYLSQLRANGGTNIQGALEEALSLDAPAGRLPLVLLLTDGAPTVGESRPEAIAQRAAELRRQRRVFTFGIGADVNAGLLEQLALQGRGTATFVRPEESVERAVGVVTERLTRPVATDVRLRIDGARLYGIQPQGPLDLFAGQDLVVLARYAGNREDANLVIEGQTADGPVKWTGRVSLPARSSDNAFVARLWATQRVGFLSAERRRSGGNSELDAELRQLGERFGLPTDLTSYLVQEPGMQVAAGNTGQRRVDAPLFLQQPMAVGAADASAPKAALMARFEDARTASEQRAAKSLADIDRETATVRSAGGHSFILRDSVWTDTRHVPSSRVVKVKAFSPGYFALLQRLPELAPILAVGERVRAQGRIVAIEVGTDGLSDLDAAALDALALDW